MMSDKCSLRSVVPKKGKKSKKLPSDVDELYTSKKKRETNEMDFIKDYIR